jgi:hypothetical protein
MLNKPKVEKLSMEQIVERIANTHSDDGLDLLIHNDVKWKIAGLNGKTFPINDEGQVPNRILLTMREEVILTARIG